MKTTPALCVLFVCATSILLYAQHPNKQKFDAAALFQPGMGAMQTARETCGKVPGPQFGNCFVQQMQAAGASPQAVAFIHAIHDNGFMRDFKDTGRVDIAFAFFPFAANENQHCLLVNGTPNVIDVDDYNLLPKDDLPKNPVYAALLRKFPNLAVFPGDRSGTGFITAKNLADGQQFIVPYVLVDGCHACARTGSMQLSFDFDRTGKFLGTRVAGVTPM
ncbi:MAG: hypothetical protein ABSC65_10450 [Acidobacteriaceae bacterium]|jgi:hypothetical protein